LLFDGEYLVSHPQQDGAPADAVMSAIGDVASGLVRTLFRADTEREIQRALNLGEEFGLKMTIYGTDAAWQHATELKKRNIPVIVQAAFPREPRLEQNEDPVRRLNDPPLEYLKEQHDIWKEQCLAVVKLHQAGVPFAFSSDGDTDIFLANVRKHIALGLPKEAALNALTKGAAEVLGVSDKLGTIQNGKLASLVLMDGDFAAEATKVKIVLVDGKKFEVGGN
jgi:imidazolonepropionase-like amidohydrolase